MSCRAETGEKAVHRVELFVHFEDNDVRVDRIHEVETVDGLDRAGRARGRSRGPRRAGRCDDRARRSRRPRGSPPAASRRRTAFLFLRAFLIVSALPATIDPTGAPRPFEKHMLTVSAHATYSRNGTPVATTAFASRAPSRWTFNPRDSASALIRFISSNGKT